MSDFTVTWLASGVSIVAFFVAIGILGIDPWRSSSSVVQLGIIGAMVFGTLLVAGAMFIIARAIVPGGKVDE